MPKGIYKRKKAGYWKGKKRPDVSLKLMGHLVTQETRAKLKKAHLGRKTGRSWNRGLSTPLEVRIRQNISALKGVKHPNWKGEEVGYHGIHLWLRRHFGKAYRCEQCEKIGIGQKFHWSLVQGKNYERKRENFIQLCVSCHRKYDWTEEIGKKISQSMIGNSNARKMTLYLSP